MHGAVIEHGGCIISSGYNIPKPLTPQNPYLRMRHEAYRYRTHAEWHAIRKAVSLLRKTTGGINDGLKGATLYVTRITNGLQANSKPCPMCELAIRASGIKKVVYSVDENRWEEMEIC